MPDDVVDLFSLGIEVKRSRVPVLPRLSCMCAADRGEPAVLGAHISPTHFICGNWTLQDPTDVSRFSQCCKATYSLVCKLAASAA
jgi:hypothetical protein